MRNMFASAGGDRGNIDIETVGGLAEGIEVLAFSDSVVGRNSVDRSRSTCSCRKGSTGTRNQHQLTKVFAEIISCKVDTDRL